MTAAAINAEPVDSADAQTCLTEYFRELAQRFDTGFDPALSLTPGTDELVPPTGAFLIVRVDGVAVGCGAFKAMPPDAAYLKRMWIKADMRGRGLGRRLLAALEERARAAGYRVARLETNSTLAEAQALYQAAGYREVPPFNDEPYAHHWFEKRLV